MQCHSHLVFNCISYWTKFDVGVNHGIDQNCGSLLLCLCFCRFDLSRFEQHFLCWPAEGGPCAPLLTHWCNTSEFYLKCYKIPFLSCMEAVLGFRGGAQGPIVQI